MIEINVGTPENLVIAIAHGKVTAADYDNTLIPAIEAKLKTQKKVRLLYELDNDFAGFTAGALWDDAKLGLSHLTAFEAVAIVTDVHWIADAAKLFAFFLRCPVKVFASDKRIDAEEWVATVAWQALAEASTHW
jgi:hypothetical protein